MPVKMLGREVGDVGFGLMGLTWGPNPPSDEEAFVVMREAIANGCTLWNGAEFYGTPERNSLTLLRDYFKKYPEDADKVVLNIKGAAYPDLRPNNSPAFVRQSVENCVRMLDGTYKMDMFGCARRDGVTPLRDLLNGFVELIDEGKIGGLALSEVSAATIREASKVTKVLGVEIELSMFCTDPLTNGITEACAELEIPIHAYCPLGRGMLTGTVKSPDEFAESDYRRILPRYQSENFTKNLELVDAVNTLAQQKGCTAAQLALGWLVTHSRRPGMPVIIPIPGTKSVERLRENAKIVELTDEEMKKVDDILATFPVAGPRFHEFGMKLVNG